MGSFVSSLFSLLLGWIRGTAQWLWSIITSDSNGGLIGWMVRNWLPLVILLCIFGMVADFVVYLLRWQPYRVWKRCLAWILPKKLRKTPTGRHLLYADGRMVEADAEAASRDSGIAAEEVASATNSRKRVIPAQKKRFGTTQTAQTPPPLTVRTSRDE